MLAIWNIYSAGAVTALILPLGPARACPAAERARHCGLNDGSTELAGMMCCACRCAADKGAPQRCCTVFNLILSGELRQETFLLDGLLIGLG